MSILCFAGVCCLVLGKWLIFPVYGDADCPWLLMVGVNDLLYVALECFCITVIIIFVKLTVYSLLLSFILLHVFH
jgi:hypothetical protein